MSRRKEWSDWLHQTVFVMPAVLFYCAIIGIPFVLGFYYSLTNWNGVSGVIEWVGLRNYTYIFAQDDSFRNSYSYTVRYMLCAVVLTNGLGIALALMLTQSLKLRNWLRPIFLLPNVIGGVILGFIWNFIFVAGFRGIGEMLQTSLLNGWLGDSATAFWAVIIVSVWQGAGYLMVIYIAALVGLPGEVLESARMDGAKGVGLFIRIILPMIMPAVTICTFLSINGGMKVFDVILSLTRGGPFGSTESVAFDIFGDFNGNYYGLGTAKAIVLTAVITVIGLVQVYVMKRKEVQS